MSEVGVQLCMRVYGQLGICTSTMVQKKKSFVESVRTQFIVLARLSDDNNFHIAAQFSSSITVMSMSG